MRSPMSLFAFLALAIRFVHAAPTLTLPASDCSAVASQAEIDVRNIDAAVQKLDTSVLAYEGGLLPALPLIAGVTDIHLVNRKGYLDAQVVCATTVEQSTAIVEVVENTVGISIPKTVQDTIAKGNEIKAAGIATELVASLKLLQNDHDTYSAALGKSVNPAVQTRADAVILLIHNAIQQGIDYFSNP